MLESPGKCVDASRTRVCGESNEINGEKIVLCLSAEKNCLLLKSSKKNCML